MAFRAKAFCREVTRRILLGAMLFPAADVKAGEAWHHLRASQQQNIINTLAPTQLRPVAPAYLPQGFRVTLAEADASTRYANGDVDPGFRIEYRGPANQCFGLSDNKGGSRGLQKITSVQSAIGPFAIYRDPHATAEKSGSRLFAFLPVGERIVLMTPGYGDANPDGSLTACKPIPLAEFLKVAESLRWLRR